MELVQPLPRPYAFVFEVGDRLEARTRRALFACLASTVAHALFAVAFLAAWLAPSALEEEKRHPKPEPIPIAMVEAENLDEPTHDAPVADQVDRGKEEAAQGEAAPRAAPPTKPEAAKPDVPSPSKAPKQVLPPIVKHDSPTAVRAVRKQVFARAFDDSGTIAEGQAVAGTQEGATAKAIPGAAGDAGDAGGVHRDKAPDLAARFTKELPRWAADVAAWKTMSLGAKLTIEAAISLDESGRVIVPPRPTDEDTSKEAPLRESVQRTLRALVTKLALPGHLVGAGVLRVAIEATVSDLPEREDGDEIELRFSYEAKAKKGNGTFVLKSGRSVSFVVRVVAVDAASDTPAEGAESGAPTPDSSGAPVGAPPPPTAPSAAAPSAAPPVAPAPPP